MPTPLATPLIVAEPSCALYGDRSNHPVKVSVVVQTVGKGARLRRSSWWAEELIADLINHETGDQQPISCDIVVCEEVQ